MKMVVEEMGKKKKKDNFKKYLDPSLICSKFIHTWFLWCVPLLCVSLSNRILEWDYSCHSFCWSTNQMTGCSMEGEPFSLLHTGWQKKCILDILYDSLRLQPDQEYKKKKGIRESEGIASLESYHSVLSTATKKKKKKSTGPKWSYVC